MQSKPKKRMTKDLGTQFYDDNPFDHKEAMQKAISEIPQPYEPRVGDRVSLEVEVVESYHNNALFLQPVMSVQIAGRYTYSIEEKVLLAANPTLLHRAKPRIISRAEAEAMIAERLGESVEIE